LVLDSGLAMELTILIEDGKVRIPFVGIASDLIHGT